MTFVIWHKYLSCGILLLLFGASNAAAHYQSKGLPDTTQTSTAGDALSFICLLYTSDAADE